MVIVEKIRHETDLSLMEQHFPGRSRNDIKNKFKKEEKLRPKFVDKMLSERKPCDPNQFLDDAEDSSGAENENQDQSFKDNSKSKTTWCWMLLHQRDQPQDPLFDKQSVLVSFHVIHRWSSVITILVLLSTAVVRIGVNCARLFGMSTTFSLV
ncbi:transcription factor TFIIIB component B'' homolog [Daphnia pulex]|uniref:transcription factor TFIIIB component B'' homolog n=1 Tax=Daphnia pulex TaxID=6669 RepID=UPI001EDECF59|nr:transcription factor TFIIIB component B'' homolog [Daphnia pulex]